MDVKSTLKRGQAQDEEGGKELLNYLLSTNLNPSFHRPVTRLTTVNLHDSVPTVFELLSSQSFLSCPVLDADRNFRGFISMFDIVNFVTNLYWGQVLILIFQYI